MKQLFDIALSNIIVLMLKEHQISEWIYQKLKSYVKPDLKLNRRTINAVNYYKRIEAVYITSDLQSLLKAQRMLKQFERHIEDILRIINQRKEGEEQAKQIRSKIDKRMTALETEIKALRKQKRQQESKKQQNQQTIQLRYEKMQTISDEQFHEEIQNQLVDLTDALKYHAKQISQNLEEDKKVLTSIEHNQQMSQNALTKSTTKLKSMLSHPELGFIELITMTAGSLGLFLVMMIFIALF